MILKLLLLLAVVLGAVFFLRRSAAGRGGQGDSPSPSPSQSEGREALAGDRPGEGARRLAIAILVGLLTVVLVYVYIDWRRDQDVLRVRLTNSLTGEQVEYSVLRSDLYPDAFTTLDGRRITIANTDRMEVMERSE